MKMEKQEQTEINPVMVEQKLDVQPGSIEEEGKIETTLENKPTERPIKGDREKEVNTASKDETRALGIGEWMLTIFIYLIPVVNIIMMEVWAFASKGNIHRRNLSRACLLWIIILLIAYVVAMTIAGFTILDIFRQPY